MERPAARALSRIAEAARAHGLSRRALAERAGLRPETVSRIGSRGTCDYDSLARLAEAAGLRLSIEAAGAGEALPAKELVLEKRALIRSLARAHGVRTAALFGSAARGEETPRSDLDFMVEMAEGRSLLDLIGFAQDLERLLGRKADVVTKTGVKPAVLAEAQRDAVVIV